MRLLLGGADVGEQSREPSIDMRDWEELEGQFWRAQLELRELPEPFRMRLVGAVGPAHG